MAEELKIVIFPNVRISDLKREAALKKDRLTASAEAVRLTIRQKTSPLIFIKDHLQMILGTLTSAYTALTLVKRARRKTKEADASSIHTGGSKWIRQLVSFAGVMALKALAPAFVSLVKFGLKNALSKRD